MSFTAFTSRAGAFAATTLVDTCEIRRGETQVYDPATQSYTKGPGSLVWSGPCRVRAGGGISANEAEVGEQVITLRAYRATLPLSATGVESDDRLVVTQSRDPQLTALSFRVTDPQAGTDAKFRRVLLEADLG